jgi:hypothetical protein
MTGFSKIAGAAVLMFAGFGALSSAQGGQAGVWENVTPSDCDLNGSYSGIMAVVTDHARPADAYFNCDSRGMWKSTDYGQTWKKCSVTPEVSSGRSWGRAFDVNPKRDPSTFPALYFTQGYGFTCLWKCTDGGTNWTNVWKNNVFDSDGVTNITSDVGNDLCWVIMPDTLDPNFIITCLHGYWGTGNHNGLFITHDGGGKWQFMRVPFAFSGHGDIFQAISRNVWLVSDGYPSKLMRTTDAGVTWNKCSDFNIWPIRFARVGSAVYMPGNSGLYKTTDEGATWTQVTNGGTTTTVIATPTTLYTSYIQGGGATEPSLRHALISNDKTWINDPAPAGMVHGAFDANVTFDGKNYIILTANEQVGVWRYVEPATGTQAISHGAAPQSQRSAASAHAAISLSPRSAASQEPAYGLRGEKIGSCRISGCVIVITKQ